MSDGSVPIGGNLQDLVSTQKSGVKYLGQIYTILDALFPRVIGTFTMTATATRAVSEPRVQANSVVFIQATNAAAGTMQGSSKSLIPSAISPGVGFTVATSDGTNGSATATFSYYVINPV